MRARCFGLQSCVLAAKEMGGSLTARSDGSGKGAVFTLGLPIRSVGDSASNPPTTAKPPQRPPRWRGRV